MTVQLFHWRRVTADGRLEVRWFEDGPTADAYALNRGGSVMRSGVRINPVTLCKLMNSWEELGTMKQLKTKIEESMKEYDL